MTTLAPDAQAHAEVFANLNHVRFDALATDGTVATLRESLEAARAAVRLRGEEIEELVAERDDYAHRLMDATENYEIACELIGYWQQRALLMEAAVKTYAEHVWNDIKQMLGRKTR